MCGISRKNFSNNFVAFPPYVAEKLFGEAGNALIPKRDTNNPRAALTDFLEVDLGDGGRTHARMSPTFNEADKEEMSFFVPVQ